MTDNRSELDVRLSWKDESVARDVAKDSVALDRPEETPSHNIEEAGGEFQPAETDTGPADDHPPSHFTEDEDDVFQWCDDRERELEEALDQSPEGATPRVQQQLESLAQVLESASIEKTYALKLITEIEVYLANLIKAEQRKVPVDDQTFRKSRSAKLNALFAYQEAATALRAYGDQAEPVQLKVAVYATEQGGTFMRSARDLMMEAEPDYDEIEENADVEDFEDEDEDGTVRV
jgi:hypothetical protein